MSTSRAAGSACCSCLTGEQRLRVCQWHGFLLSLRSIVVQSGAPFRLTAHICDSLRGLQPAAPFLLLWLINRHRHANRVFWCDVDAHECAILSYICHAAGRSWRKLLKSFFSEKKQQFDISKVPDIYDAAKYDAIHNTHLQLTCLKVGV